MQFSGGRLCTRRLVLAFAISIVATGARAQSAAELKDGAKQLSVQEFVQVLVGNTLAGKHGEGEFFEYYDLNGTFRGISSEGPYEGRWDFEGDKVCFDFKGWQKACRIPMYNPKYNRLFFVRPDGSTGQGGGTVVAGNPQGL